MFATSLGARARGRADEDGSGERGRSMLVS